MAVSAVQRRAIRERAEFRCEYCAIEEESIPFARFHMEHIIAKQHGGGEGLDNLCLACQWCNFFKGPNLGTLVNGVLIPLFHPRQNLWTDHFELRGNTILGRTAIGQGTVALLNMNDEERRQLRVTLH